MPDLLPISAVAKVLGVTRDAVNKMVTAGRLPAHRVGRAWLVEPKDLLALVEARTGAKKEGPRDE